MYTINLYPSLNFKGRQEYDWRRVLLQVANKYVYFLSLKSKQSKSTALPFPQSIIDNWKRRVALLKQV